MRTRTLTTFAADSLGLDGTRIVAPLWRPFPWPRYRHVFILGNVARNGAPSTVTCASGVPVGSQLVTFDPAPPQPTPLPTPSPTLTGGPVPVPDPTLDPVIPEPDPGLTFLPLPAEELR